MPRITITTRDGHKQRYELSLEMEAVTIGRDSTCDISINDATVSGFHAEIRRMRGGFYIVDCQSTSGILINGERAEWTELTNGLTVQLGDSSLHILYTDPELNFLIEEKKDAEPTPAPATQATAFETPVAGETAPATGEPDFHEPQIQSPEPVYESPVANVPASPPLRRAAPLARPAGIQPGGLPGRAPYAPGQFKTKHNQGGGGGLFVIATLLLCALALIAGMALRHYEETGRLIFDDLFTKAPAVEAPKPVTVAPPKPVDEPKPEVKPEEPVKEPEHESTPEPKKIVEKDPMEGVLKENGKDKLPSLDEFVLP